MTEIAWRVATNVRPALGAVAARPRHERTPVSAVRSRATHGLCLANAERFAPYIAYSFGSGFTVKRCS